MHIRTCSLSAIHRGERTPLWLTNSPSWILSLAWCERIFLIECTAATLASYWLAAAGQVSWSLEEIGLDNLVTLWYLLYLSFCYSHLLVYRFYERLDMLEFFKIMELNLSELFKVFVSQLPLLVSFVTFAWGVNNNNYQTLQLLICRWKSLITYLIIV